MSDTSAIREATALQDVSLEPTKPCGTHLARHDISQGDAQYVDTEKQQILPSASGSSLLNRMRYGYFSAYRRLFAVIFLANTIALIVITSKIPYHTPHSTANALFSAAVVNFLFAILIRHEHVINLLFRLFTALPPTAPLWLRSVCAKIYAYGGMHSGCSSAATVWYLAYTGFVSYSFSVEQRPRRVLVANLVLTWIQVSALLAIVVLSYPSLRTKYHNYFEMSHRFAGWSAIAILWVQTFLNAHESRLIAQGSSFGRAVVFSTAFWCLLIILYCLVYPWLRLRKRTITPEYLSPHAVRLHFDHTTPDHCMSVRLTSSPLLETHSFASIPNDASNGEGSGFFVIVTNAGDWTSDLIKTRPKAISIKGAPTYDVPKVAAMFAPCLVVVTGSGIGACLSLARAAPHPRLRIVWCARSPYETFGQGVVDAVQRADRDATIWDTRRKGQPDLLRLSWSVFRRERCEAALVISNRRLTEHVVYGFESRGMPCFGTIFDS